MTKNNSSSAVAAAAKDAKWTETRRKPVCLDSYTAAVPKSKFKM